MEKNQLSKIESARVQQEVEDKVTTTGEYTFIDLEREPTEDEINLLRQYTRGDVSARIGLRDLIKSEVEVKNLTPTCGRNLINQYLAAQNIYGAFGNGTTAFTNASTKLNNELYRKINADAAVDGNITYVDWFINAADVANQTFQEFGAFIWGDGSKDSGVAFSLVQTCGWVKSGAMFISLKITLS